LLVVVVVEDVGILTALTGRIITDRRQESRNAEQQNDTQIFPDVKNRTKTPFVMQTTSSS